MNQTPHPLDETPRIWVLGSFAMTGAALPLHATRTLAAAGAEARAISFHRGAFADGSVLDPMGSETPSLGVIYLRSLMRRGASWRNWTRRWRALVGLARRTDQVALVTVPSRPSLSVLTEWCLAQVLHLQCGRRAHRYSLTTPPQKMLQDLGVSAVDVPANVAEAQVLGSLTTRSPNRLHLLLPHIERALAGPAGQALNAATRADLLALATAALQVRPQTIEATLFRASLPSGPNAPRSMSAAFSPGLRDPRVPRVVEHMRLLRLPRRQIARIQPDKNIAGTDPASVMLRALTGQSRAEDAQQLANLDTPVLGAVHRLTRMDWLLALSLRLPVTDPTTLVVPWASAELTQAVRQRRAALSTAPPPGIRLCGLAASGTGLSQNFWMSAQALRIARLPVTLDPIDTPPALTLAPAPVPAADTRPVTLYHLNADRIPQTLLDRPAQAHSFTIGFLLWELDRLPREHRLALDMLDEIWVPSIFLRRLYQRHFDRKVVYMRKGLTLPDPAPWPAPPPGVRRFVTCFDAGSSVARKNPLAAVRAFRAAFGSARRDVELIVKTTPAPRGHWGDPEGQMTQIEAIAAKDPRITVLRETLPFDRLLGLIASATALISPHRAEGFGYFPAFALTLGVPVIATDYSGTQDFCTPDTSLPIPAELVPVPKGQAIFHTPGARWAEVNPEALAAALTATAQEPVPARARAQRGKLLMQTDYSLSALATRYDQRLRALGLVRPAPATVPQAAAGG